MGCVEHEKRAPMRIAPILENVEKTGADLSTLSVMGHKAFWLARLLAGGEVI